MNTLPTLLRSMALLYVYLYLAYLVQLSYLGKLSNPENHFLSLNLLIFQRTIMFQMIKLFTYQ